MSDYISRQAAIQIAWCYVDDEDAIEELKELPTADVRKNIKAKKVIGGGEHDGATCWFECSHCHGTVDIEDAYCKHCGAVLEYQRGEQNG